MTALNNVKLKIIRLLNYTAFYLIRNKTVTFSLD